MPMPAFNDNPNDYLESHKIRKVQNDQPPQSPPQKRREIDVTPPPFLTKTVLTILMASVHLSMIELDK